MRWNCTQFNDSRKSIAMSLEVGSVLSVDKVYKVQEFRSAPWIAFYITRSLPKRSTNSFTFSRQFTNLLDAKKRRYKWTIHNSNTSYQNLDCEGVALVLIACSPTPHQLGPDPKSWDRVSLAYVCPLFLFWLKILSPHDW